MKIITDKSTALELKEQLTEMKAAPVTGNHFLESALCRAFSGKQPRVYCLGFRVEGLALGIDFLVT